MPITEQSGVDDPATGLRSEANDPRWVSAFPKLSEAQIKALEPYGTYVSKREGEVVWSAGTVDLCMYVVVEGQVKVLDGRTHLPLATHAPGSFSGDIDILSGQASMVTGVAGADSKLLEVPSDCVRSIVGESPDLGEVILRAFLMRRALLIETRRVGPLVVGSRYSPDTLRIREFLSRNHYPVTWEDLEANPRVGEVLEQFHVTEEDTPVVVLPTGQVMRKPSNAAIAHALGLKRPVEARIYDLVIVGAGPAGLAAAVYGASEGLETLVLDSTGPGGQAGSSSKIENYMGFPLGITGHDLAEGAVVQAEKFGARLTVPGEAKSIGCNSVAGHEVNIEGAGPIHCKCIILAPGARYRRLEAPGMERFEGRGIYYAATNVERVLCGSSQVAVVGGGNSAGQATVFLAESVRHVFLIVRGKDLRDSMSSYLARRIEKLDRVTVLLESEVTGVDGSDHLERITITNRGTGEVRTENASGLFVMIGAIPHTAWLPDQIRLDDKGFILTGANLATGTWPLERSPYFLETSCPGVFAAGDARANSIKRVASAVGEGSMAVSLVHQFLST